MPRPFVAHNVGRFRYDYAAASTTTLDKSTAGDSKCEEGSHALGAQHGKLASYHGSPPRYHDAGASHNNPEARVHEIEDLLHAVLSGSTVDSGHVHGSVKIVIDGPIYIGLCGPVDSEFRGHTDIEIRGPIEVERCATTSSENAARQPTTRRSCSFPPDDQPAYTNSDRRSPSSRPAPTSTYEPATESINPPRAPANFNPCRGESISTPCFRDNRFDFVDTRETISAPPFFTRGRCQAITLKGSQCKRNGKPNFCYQHVNKLITVPGFNTRTTKASQYVNFEDWIPSYLHPKTQARLRVEMEKTGSPSDVPGYIYVFEIKDLTEPEPDIIKLKVGYTKNLPRRLSQWNRQCRSQQHVLRGYYPEPEDATLLPGMLRPGVMVPWTHRLESLVHIELEDLASTFTYLTPGWQAMPAPGAPKDTLQRDARSRQRPNTSSSAIPEWRPIRRYQCQDCSVTHKEIFEFWRWAHGPNKGREWECLVRPIIERWAQFVKLYL